MSQIAHADMAVKLKQKREEAKLSQEKVAASLGIAQQAYSRYENRKAQMDLARLIKFCKLTGTSLEEFLPFYDKEEVQSV